MSIPLNKFEIADKDNENSEEMEERELSVSTIRDLVFESHANIFNQCHEITQGEKSDLICVLHLCKEKAKFVALRRDPSQTNLKVISTKIYNTFIVFVLFFFG